MNNWDLLLEWMTHVGSGAWGAFREAVVELANDSGALDEQALLRTLRIALSDLGHVDFFVGGSRRWRVLRPALVGFAGAAQHLLVGGRTRLLTERFCTTVASRATVTVAEIIPGLSRVHVVGDPDVLATAATVVGVEYIPDAAAKLSAGLPLIRSLLETGKPTQEPINWSVRSWSFQDEKWVNDKLKRTVREYSNRHGVRRYMVHAGKLGLLEIEKRASFYCAAVVRGARIVRYSHKDKSLRAPLWAPLPEVYARAACLASGRLGVIDGSDILFENVDPRVASTMFIGLGQDFPIPEAK
ncbi:hypothetical protein [Nannocystis pusilla]|uniref:hypothetical protein n=1 Tax=Nannocystis pusilla TaxID=889268 RepID=UPI003DA2F142